MCFKVWEIEWKFIPIPCFKCSYCIELYVYILKYLEIICRQFIYLCFFCCILQLVSPIYNSLLEMFFHAMKFFLVQLGHCLLFQLFNLEVFFVGFYFTMLSMIFMLSSCLISPMWQPVFVSIWSGFIVIWGVKHTSWI